jgi:hypothetical protein
LLNVAPVTRSPLTSMKGRRVRFCIRDVHLPDPHAVLDELHGGDTLNGTVVDLSDSGEAGGAFVVVEVDRLRDVCIVAADKIEPVVARRASAAKR